MDLSKRTRREPRHNKTIVNTAKNGQLTRQEKRERCILALFFFGRVENKDILLDMTEVSSDREHRQLNLLKKVDWVLIEETSSPHIYKVIDAPQKGYMKYLRKRIFSGRGGIPSLDKCIQYLFSRRIFEYIPQTHFKCGIISKSVPGGESNAELLIRWYKLNIENQEENADGKKEKHRKHTSETADNG